VRFRSPLIVVATGHRRKSFPSVASRFLNAIRATGNHARLAWKNWATSLETEQVSADCSDDVRVLEADKYHAALFQLARKEFRTAGIKSRRPCYPPGALFGPNANEALALS
jgi:hypothetical protein